MNFITQLWNDYAVKLLDILVVSLIIYYFLILIRGTRAVQVLRGLLIILLATIIAPLLQFRTISWILEKFWVAGFIAFVVVFQSEIRTALANLGKQTSLGRISSKQKMIFVDEIVKATQVLKRKKCGALMVIEQSTGLKNYIDSGVQINGDISAELIISIFNTGSMIHDGAIIIHGDRIVAAGCILPLADEMDAKKILGTRHRAAIGITEVSDACAIVVSEQSGRVAFAHGKNYDSNVDVDKLKKNLVSIYGAETRNNRHDTILNKENAWLKVIAVILAGVLWYYITHVTK